MCISARHHITVQANVLRGMFLNLLCYIRANKSSTRIHSYGYACTTSMLLHQIVQGHCEVIGTATTKG